MNPQTPNSHKPLEMSALPSPAAATMRSDSSLLPSASQPIAAPAMSAADSDDIETEWLDRTHHVLQSFATDPYQLSKEFAAIRADYIKHRYGKVIHSAAKKGEE